MDLTRVRNEVESVVALYDQRCDEGDYDDDDGSGCLPVVVLECISRDDYQRWLRRHEGELRRWLYEPLTDTTGRVIVYSFSTEVLGGTAFEIVQGILGQLRERGNATVGPSRSLRGAASPTCTIGNAMMEPDFSLRPIGLPFGELPSLIVEVSHQNDSWANLVAKLGI